MRIVFRILQSREGNSKSNWNITGIEPRSAFCMIKFAIFGKQNLSVPDRVLSGIYHLGEKSWVAEGYKPPRGVPPRKFFEINMHWDAIWCILRHNFEKCYSVCTNLVASWWFFRYSYLYTVMITIFFFLGGGGSFYPSNTLDRTLSLFHQVKGWKYIKLSWIWYSASVYMYLLL